MRTFEEQLHEELDEINKTIESYRKIERTFGGDVSAAYANAVGRLYLAKVNLLTLINEYINQKYVRIFS